MKGKIKSGSWFMGRFILFDGDFNGSRRTAMYDTKTGEMQLCTFNLSICDAGFHNDFDRGLPFWPTRSFIENDKTKAATVLYPDKLRSYWKRGLELDDYFNSFPVKSLEKEKWLKETINNYPINDNPMLMIATLKDEYGKI